MTPVDVGTEPRNFPGQFQGLRASGARGLIESYGTVEFVLHQNGAPLQVAPGRKVMIDIPIYTGLHRTPEEVVEAAIQEDVDVLGVSILSGAHMTVFPRITRLLKERGADDILLVGGGVIPDEDLPKLAAVGVREILLQDTPPAAIVDMIRRIVAERGAR